MKRMHHVVITALIVLSSTSFAQSNMQSHGMAEMGHGNMAHDQQQATNEYTNGQVKKVNLETNQITIRHEVIKSLDMPPMTMVYIAKNKSITQGVKPGDKIKFTATKNNGKLYITNLINEGSE
ncbi:copper-binding protein [Polynucleobacter brandtiae]|uniref:Cu/Ag efflux protein CusF n=1 Tax=Polynucleobacter brandtiae TaxID=1938816 RepID=A0A2M8VIK5_9BURK|nr:copper-binding protein [Polynucleobacter brandtiae]PJI76680.1 Cu/Ag efflux protein CusF [Polynucleobacter brandtiae]